MSSEEQKIKNDEKLTNFSEGNNKKNELEIDVKKNQLIPLINYKLNPILSSSVLNYLAIGISLAIFGCVEENYLNLNVYSAFYTKYYLVSGIVLYVSGLFDWYDGKELLYLVDFVLSFFFISNSSHIAGQPDVYYDVKLDDKMFEVAFANIKTKADMLKMIVQISTMDVKDIPKVTYYRTDNLEIEFLDSPKTSWCIDGEEYESTSTKFSFRVEQSMKMLVPKENIKDLFDE